MSPEERNRFMEELGCVFDRNTVSWVLRISHEQRITDSMIRSDPQMVMEHVLNAMQRKAFQFIWELQQKARNYDKVEVITYYDKNTDYRGTEVNGIVMDEAKPYWVASIGDGI